MKTGEGLWYMHQLWELYIAGAIPFKELRLCISGHCSLAVCAYGQLVSFCAANTGRSTKHWIFNYRQKARHSGFSWYRVSKGFALQLGNA
jgi:hypothetical protein